MFSGVCIWEVVVRGRREMVGVLSYFEVVSVGCFGVRAVDFKADFV